MGKKGYICPYYDFIHCVYKNYYDLIEQALFIKYFWLTLTLIPAPFLSHFFETNQNAGWLTVPFELINLLLVVLLVIVSV